MKLIALTFILLAINHANSLAVFSVDLGTEWMKVGIVSPGVPMEIALNKESKRKTPCVLSFRDEIRSFGEDAQTVGIRFPKNAYIYLLDLLGKDINHPLVKQYQQRFPYYEIVEDPSRNSIRFKHDDNTFFTPQELIAQLLHKAKEMAELGAQQPIKEGVLTVPGYFNQAERKALLEAAQLADIKVLQLINDYMAVALNYGIFRTKDFNETAQYVMFYDMGASSTTATIVSMQNVKTKERGYVETHPQISVIGVGFDRTLGGLEMQIRLRNYLGEKFNELKKTPNDVFKNPRAMAKLFKEAGRVKNVLSANNDIVAQIEGLLDEQDYKLPVSRDTFESLNEALFERVAYPVEQALKAAGLTMDLISQVVLVGAGTRVPKVQEKLQQIVKMDLAKNLNTDEAAVIGAVYKAADLSTGFQVKKFITKDAVLFPIQVAFQRETEDTTKHVRRMLFGAMNHYPQKKVITFNKHTDDFSININYAELDMYRENEIEYLGSGNLSQIHIKGVAAALGKNQGENVESKGIKAHFTMDESGLLVLSNVEFVFEKKVQPEAEEEGAFSKLGSTISKLFSGNEDVKAEPSDAAPEKENSTEEQAPGEFNSTTNANDTQKDTKTQPKDSKDKEIKPKIVTVKETLIATEKVLTLDLLTKEQLKLSIDKLAKFNKIEFEMNRRASALNNLESFVIDMQTKLSEDEYSDASTPDETAKILAACSEVSDWLYEDGADADADTYEAKLDHIRSLTQEVLQRVFEHKERPDALQALHSMLNSSRHFLHNARNLTKSTNPDKDVFTDIEIEALDKLITETEEWRDSMVGEQKKLKKYEPVKLTVKNLVDHMHALDREMKYLVNKLKIWKPRKPPTDENKKDNKTKQQQEGDKEEKVGDAKDEKEQKGDEEEIKMEQEEQEERPMEEEPLEIADESAGDGESTTTKDKHDQDEHSEL